MSVLCILAGWQWRVDSLAVLMTVLPSVLVLLSLLLRLKFMLLVALVRDMLGARRTNDSMRLASRDDRLGTLALELMGAPAASSELTDRRALVAEQRGRWEGASLLDDSDTELTSGELTLTRPMEMAALSAAAAAPACRSPVGVLRSLSAPAPSPVSVPLLDAEPASLVAVVAGDDDSTTTGSWPSAPGPPAPPGPPPLPGPATAPSTPPPTTPASSRLSALLVSTRVELRLTSLLLATLHTELLLPFRLDELAPAPAAAGLEPPLSGQLFFTRLLQDGGVPETVDETGLGDGADSGS